MRFNENKNKVMIFNTGRKYDVMEGVDQFKLICVILNSDMKWYDNTNYIGQKGYARVCMLRRLNAEGAGCN